MYTIYIINDRSRRGPHWQVAPNYNVLRLYVFYNILYYTILYYTILYYIIYGGFIIFYYIHIILLCFIMYHVL